MCFIAKDISFYLLLTTDIYLHISSRNLEWKKSDAIKPEQFLRRDVVLDSVNM